MRPERHELVEQRIDDVERAESAQHFHQALFIFEGHRAEEMFVFVRVGGVVVGGGKREQRTQERQKALLGRCRRHGQNLRNQLDAGFLLSLAQARQQQVISGRIRRRFHLPGPAELLARLGEIPIREGEHAALQKHIGVRAGDFAQHLAGIGRASEVLVTHCQQIGGLGVLVAGLDGMFQEARGFLPISRFQGNDRQGIENFGHERPLLVPL